MGPKVIHHTGRPRCRPPERCPSALKTPQRLPSPPSPTSSSSFLFRGPDEYRVLADNDYLGDSGACRPGAGEAEQGREGHDLVPRVPEAQAEGDEDPGPKIAAAWTGR